MEEKEDTIFSLLRESRQLIETNCRFPVVSSPMAKRLQQIVWKEITEVLVKAVPEAKECLYALGDQ